jgi:hypothetical protein
MSWSGEAYAGGGGGAGAECCSGAIMMPTPRGRGRAADAGGLCEVGLAGRQARGGAGRDAPRAGGERPASARQKKLNRIQQHKKDRHQLIWGQMDVNCFLSLHRFTLVYLSINSVNFSVIF